MSHEMDSVHEQKEADRAAVARTIIVHLRMPFFLSMYFSQIIIFHVRVVSAHPSSSHVCPPVIFVGWHPHMDGFASNTWLQNYSKIILGQRIVANARHFSGLQLVLNYRSI